MSDRTRRWLISGVSSGLGRALLEKLAADGEQVIGTVRKTADRDRLAEFGSNVIPVQIDLTDSADNVTAVVQQAIEQLGGLDILVNCAGYGLIGAVEETTEDEARHQLETNFWGPWKLTRAALPFLRASSAAHIVNVSSIAGFSGAPAMGLYDASKFALEGMSEALRLELEPLGVRVTIVEPGGFRTNWAGPGLVMSENEIPEYAPSTEWIRKRLPSQSGSQPGDPERAAVAIATLIDSPKPPLRLPLGSDASKALRAKSTSILSELDEWSAVSASTDFPAEEQGLTPDSGQIASRPRP